MSEVRSLLQPTRSAIPNPAGSDGVATIEQALRQATSTDEVYRLLVEQGARLAGAVAASVSLLDGSAEWVDVVHHQGYDNEVMQRFGRFQADADVPIAEAIRTERLVFTATHDELLERYEGIRDSDLAHKRGANVCLPLRVDDQVVGAIGLTYDGPVALDDELTAVLDALSRAGGRAMERTLALTPEGARFRRLMEAARGRLAFVSAATRELSRSLDEDEVLQTLTELVVPRFADWASVLLPEGDELVAATLVDRDHLQVDLRERAGQFRCAIAVDTPSTYVYRTGEPTLARGVDDDVRSRMAAYPELSYRLGETRERLIVPITAQNRILGVLTLAHGEGMLFDEDDLSVAVELASRAGTALDNAVRFTAERDMVEMLQRAVLPAAMPETSKLILAARYLPATVSAKVGGDWYDAFELRDGRVGLCVGDVVGHGLAAAACMGQLRNALRVYALDGAATNEVVEALNRFTIDTAITNYTTLLYAVFDPATGGLEWTNAGHPPMVCRRADRVEPLEGGHGMPIGIIDHEYTESRATLSSGDVAVIYTDGLIERRSESLTAGLDRLGAAVDAHRDMPLDVLVDRLLEDVAPPERTDDVCVLAVECTGP